MEKTKHWMGSDPTTCDICEQPLHKVFIDGKTSLGPWGIMCVLCHNIHGAGLGTGRGQKYKKTDTTWTKIEG